jgi:LPXTG-motif cell wall-anchored protein
MPLPLAELPRTGPSDVRLLLAVAGLALVFGGGGIAARGQGRIGI